MRKVSEELSEADREGRPLRCVLKPPMVPQMANLKLTAVMVLYLFLPLTALTYYFSRRRRRIIEVERILTLLRADPAYRQVHEAETLRYYLWAVAYASAVACAGLALLFFSTEVGLAGAEFPALTLGGAEFPQKGSRL